jgi:peptidyl-prolyl cis-trans isomerase C
MKSVALALSLSLLGYTSNIAAQSLDRDAGLVLAKRGDATVTIADFDVLLEGAPKNQRADIVDSAARIDQLLDSRLMSLQMAAKGRKEGLDKDPEVQRRLAQAMDKVFGEIVLDVLSTRADPGNVELLAKETYAAKADSFVTPATWTVRHLLLAPEPGEGNAQFMSRVNAMYKRATSGTEDFEKLAREHSKDSSVAQNGGEFVLEKNGQFAPEFEAAAVKLSAPKSFAPLTKTQFGWHIIQLQNRQVERKLTFAEVRDSIVSSLRDQHRERIKAQLLSDMRAANPEYFEENIQKLATRYSQTEEATVAASESGQN